MTPPPVPPPPERRTPVRYRGRLRWPRQRLTRRLAYAGVVDPVETGVYSPPPPAKFRKNRRTTTMPTLSAADLDRIAGPRPASEPLAAAQHALRQLSTAQAAAQRELDQLHDNAVDDARDLCDRLAAGGDLPLLDVTDRAQRRAELQAQLEVLEHAVMRMQRHVAQLTANDPLIAEWNATRRRIADEWKQLQTLPDNVRQPALDSFLTRLERTPA